jgi:hypothetical protein
VSNVSVECFVLNSKLARQMLQDRLDELTMDPDSRRARLRSKIIRRKSRSARRHRAKTLAKQEATTAMNIINASPTTASEGATPPTDAAVPSSSSLSSLPLLIVKAKTAKEKRVERAAKRAVSLASGVSDDINRGELPQATSDQIIDDALDGDGKKKKRGSGYGKAKGSKGRGRGSK